MVKNRAPGWWYPYIFVAGFGVVLAVNAVLIYTATSTFTGLSTSGAYEKGLNYNTNLAMTEAQEKLGWVVSESFTVGPDSKALEVRVSYRDAQNKPVEGLKVRAAFNRPTKTGLDHEVTFTPVGDGVYGASETLPLPGLWEVEFVATGEGDVSYQHAQRISMDNGQVQLNPKHVR